MRVDYFRLRHRKKLVLVLGKMNLRTKFQKISDEKWERYRGHKSNEVS